MRARAQRGLITMDQLDSLGVTRSARRHRLESGEWLPVLPCVLRMYWADETWALRASAAVLWSARGGGVLSHESAATIHGLLPVPSCVHVCGRGLRTQGWLVARRQQTTECVIVDGLPVTPVARTLLDLVVSSPEAVVRRAMRTALSMGLVHPDDFQRFLDHRLRGAAALARLVRVPS